MNMISSALDHPYLLAYALGVATPYLVSRFGGVFWTDLQALWAKVMPASK